MIRKPHEEKKLKLTIGNKKELKHTSLTTMSIIPNSKLQVKHKKSTKNLWGIVQIINNTQLDSIGDRITDEEVEITQTIEASEITGIEYNIDSRTINNFKFTTIKDKNNIENLFAIYSWQEVYYHSPMLCLEFYCLEQTIHKPSQQTSDSTKIEIGNPETINYTVWRSINLSSDSKIGIVENKYSKALKRIDNINTKINFTTQQAGMGRWYKENEETTTQEILGAEIKGFSYTIEGRTIKNFRFSKEVNNNKIANICYIRLGYDYQDPFPIINIELHCQNNPLIGTEKPKIQFKTNNETPRKMIEYKSENHKIENLLDVIVTKIKSLEENQKTKDKTEVEGYIKRMEKAETKAYTVMNEVEKRLETEIYPQIEQQERIIEAQKQEIQRLKSLTIKAPIVEENRYNSQFFHYYPQYPQYLQRKR